MSSISEIEYRLPFHRCSFSISNDLNQIDICNCKMSIPPFVGCYSTESNDETQNQFWITRQWRGAHLTTLKKVLDLVFFSFLLQMAIFNRIVKPNESIDFISIHWFYWYWNTLPLLCRKIESWFIQGLLIWLGDSLDRFQLHKILANAFPQMMQKKKHWWQK